MKPASAGPSNKIREVIHMEKFTYFYGGVFSQWHRSNFVVEVDGVMMSFNCAEQYMMFSKARLFGDKAAMEAIMRTFDPSEQKALGRTVKGFDADIWNQHARNYVFQGNYAKFSQDIGLKQRLYATVGTTLVEASPRDTIWGIGLSCTDARAKDRKKWRGTNWLGEVLTNVREAMMKAEAEVAI